MGTGDEKVARQRLSKEGCRWSEGLMSAGGGGWRVQRTVDSGRNVAEGFWGCPGMLRAARQHRESPCQIDPCGRGWEAGGQAGLKALTT